MCNSKIVPLMIYIPKNYRDKLRVLAAERNLSHPDEVLSAARIGRDIIVQHLDSTTHEGSSHGNQES